MSIRPEPGCCDENAFDRAFVHDRAVEVAHGRHVDRVGVALGLDDDLAAPNRMRIEDHGINAGVAACPGHPHLGALVRKLLLEQLTDQGLEVPPANSCQVGPLAELRRNILAGHEATVVLTQLEDRRNRREPVERRAANALEPSETLARINTAEVYFHELALPGLKRKNAISNLATSPTIYVINKSIEISVSIAFTASA